MAVDADTVRRVAHLARISVAEDEVENLRGELNAIYLTRGRRKGLRIQAGHGQAGLFDTP